MTDVKLGVLLWNQATYWPAYEAAARRIDELGYDHLWAWDNLYAIFGDPYQPIFEGWMSLAAWAKSTERIRLGLLVGANTFRNPGLTAKLAATLDHISDGRAILGLGAAWMEPEHREHGIEFGRSPGQRLDWLEEAVDACRRLLDGETVTSPPDGRYELAELRHAPTPLQGHLPIMIGGSGEKKTLRTVARHADMWNGMGSVETMRRKIDVLRGHCEDVGRDPATIERSAQALLFLSDDESWLEAQRAKGIPRATMIGTPSELVDVVGSYVEAGVDELIVPDFTLGPASRAKDTYDRFLTEVAAPFR